MLTTFIVNVSAEPTAVKAVNGTTELKKVQKNSKEEVLNAELSAGEFAYYYDAAPAIETYALDAENEFAVGSTGFLPEVSEADYSNMNNYKGTSPKDGSVFVDQIQKRYGDINNNGVYDYAFTAFPQDGGTKQRGSVSGMAGYNVTEEDGNLVIEVTAANVKNLNAIATGYVLGGTGALADESVVDVFALESADEIVLK